MITKLTFRMRLALLLCIVVIGMGGLSAVALSGLKSQEEAARVYQRLTEFNAQLDQLALTILTWSDRKRSVNDASMNTLVLEMEEGVEAFRKDLVDTPERLQWSNSPMEVESLAEMLQVYLTSSVRLLSAEQRIGFSSESGLRGLIEDQGGELLDAVSFLAIVRQAVLGVREAERGYLFEPNEANRSRFDERFIELQGRIDSLNLEERVGPNLRAYLTSIEQFHASVRALVELQQAHALILERLEVERQNLANQVETRLIAAGVESRKAASDARATLLTMSVVTAFVVLILMATTGLLAHRALQRVMADLNTVRQGDLTARLRVDETRNDEFDQLSDSVNQMTEGLAMVVGDVSRVTNETHGLITDLDSSIESIAESNQSISTQTASLASATEEISTTIERISESTQSLSQQSDVTHRSAEEGGHTIHDLMTGLTSVVSQVSDTGQKLDELGGLSRSIDSVVVTINGLAEQTNLLALNAAIEAARAGDAGRGFSVVADEVRSLAERTVSATGHIERDVRSIQKATQSVIDTMSTSIDSLRDLETKGNQAGEAIKSIEENAGTSASSTLEMAESVREVATTVRAMSEDMDRIALDLERDQRSITDARARSEKITTLARELNLKMGEFRLAKK